MLLLGCWTGWPGLSALPVPPPPNSMPGYRSLRPLGIRIQSPDPALGSRAIFPHCPPGVSPPCSRSSPTQVLLGPLDVPRPELGV